MVNFQSPAFPDLNNFCNKHLHKKLLSQFRAVHSYGTRNTRKANKTAKKLVVHINVILDGLCRTHL